MHIEGTLHTYVTAEYGEGILQYDCKPKPKDRGEMTRGEEHQRRYREKALGETWGRKTVRRVKI